jgi:hypothetical protein
MLVVMPGTDGEHAVDGARTSCLLKPGSDVTSISELLTGSACSSRSARPVRRTTRRTPGSCDELRFDAGRQPVALGQRRARRSHQEDGERALVELGQEAGAVGGLPSPRLATVASAADGASTLRPRRITHCSVGS